MNLRRLEHLLAVADHRSFSRAAEALGISQPALSRSIAAIEAQAGRKLFDRTRQGVQVTAEALPYVARARELITELYLWEDSLRDASAMGGALVSFGAGPLVAMECFSRLFADIVERAPRLHLTTMIASGSELVAALNQRRIGFAVFSDLQLLSTSGLSVEPVGEIRSGIAVRRDHPLLGRARVSIQDVAQYPILSGRLSSAQDLLLAKAMHGAGGLRPVLTPTITCENFEILHDATARSDAVWIGNSTSLMLKDDALRPLMIEDFEFDRTQLVMVRLADTSLSPAQALVADTLAGILRDEPFRGG